MKDVLITTFYRVLEAGPASEEFRMFGADLEADRGMADHWYDFFIEQDLAGQLPAEWYAYRDRIPDLAARLAMHREIHLGVRAGYDKQLKAELRTLLAKEHAASVKNRRILFRRVAAAAAVIGIISTALWLQKTGGDVQGARLETTVPLLVVEPFALESVSEEMVVQGLVQRIPAKLAMTSGIYPATSYAVNHISIRKQSSMPAEALQATYVIRGGVSRSNGFLEVESRLLDVSDNREIWKETFTVRDDPKSLDDLHDKVSLAVADALQVNVDERTRGRLSRDISVNNNAVTYFLRGEREWSERTQTSLKEALQWLKWAADEDPSSAVILGYLALAYGTYAETGWGSEAHWDSAITLAQLAMSDDPFNAEAMIVLGDYAESVEKDYTKAGEYFLSALEQKPGDAKVHQAIAELHLRTGRIDEGSEHMNLARILEPEHRVVRWVETKYLTATGRLEDARHAADDLMQMYPDFPYIRNFYWQYHLSKGDHAMALQAIPVDAEPDSRDYMRGMVHVDAADFDRLHTVYPDSASRPATFVLLEHIQRDEWEEARGLIREMLLKDEFHVLALAQTSDFAIFNKMKKDPGVQDICNEFGIHLHHIPEYPAL